MRIYFLIVAIALMSACKKEAALTPSEPQTVQLLPQGNSSYDDSIMACYNQYNTYILYRFTQGDYAYNYINRKKDSAFNANPAYISPVLRAVYDNIINFFPEPFLKRTMPYKILLASYIGAGATRSATGYDATYATLTIGWADSTLLNLASPAQLKAFRVNMVRAYLDRAYRATALHVPVEFQVSLPAGVEYRTITTTLQKNQNGIIEPFGPSLNVTTDFLGYLQAMMTRPKAEIENAYFRPAIDSKGMFKKKYAIVAAYFKAEFGFDPQDLGNNF